MANWDFQNKCLNVMTNHKIGQIILPTGSGKSRIEFNHAKRLMVRDDGIHQIVVIVAPRIILCQQLIKNFYEFVNSKYGQVKEAFTFVSSGNIPHIRINGKLIHSYNIGISTLDIEQIVSDINKARKVDVDSVIFTTYASFDKCIAGIKKGIIGHEKDTEVHLIADEAHYFVRNNEKDSSMRPFNALKNNLGMFDSRFFFTATRRVSDNEDEDGTKMNNEDVYGPVIFEMKPSDLIQRGVICEPRLHKITMPSEITEENFDNYAGDVLFRAFKVHEKIVNEECKDPSIEKIGGKVLVAVKGSEQLYSLINNGFVEKARNRGINVAWTMSNDDVGTFFNGKEYRVEDFLLKVRDICFKADGSVKNSTRLIALHYDRLTEGIDLPSMTGLIVLRGMNQVKKVQNIGRVLRTHPADHCKNYGDSNWAKPYSYVVVPNFEGVSEFDELIVQLRNEYNASIQVETRDDAVGLDDNNQMELQNIEYSVSKFKYASGKIQHKVEELDVYKNRVWKSLDNDDQLELW